MIRRLCKTGVQGRELGVMDVRGSLVFIDAMVCQAKTVKLNRQCGGNYLLGPKGNQSSLRGETQEAFEAVQQLSSENIDEASAASRAAGDNRRSLQNGWCEKRS